MNKTGFGVIGDLLNIRNASGWVGGFDSVAQSVQLSLKSRIEL